jgi:hypothetical protein
MITWDIPLERYKDTYNGQPLVCAGLAVQKNHYALYRTGALINPRLVKVLDDAYKKAGRKLDMGKSCVRFKKLEDLPLDAVGKVIAAIPPDELIRVHETLRPKTK